MPDVGEGLIEAEILKWHVQPGDTVTDGQVVCEVETAKAAVELPIPFDGVVGDLVYPEGATVSVGEVIITVDVSPGCARGAPQPGGRQPVLVGYGVAEGTSRRAARRNKPAALATGAPPRLESGTPVRQVAGAAGHTPLAKPPVRKLAKDLGIHLASVVPSGPGGLVTRDDVHAAAVAAAAPQRADRPDARESRIPIKGVRKDVARAMVSSAFTAPHVTEFVTIDMTRMRTFLRKLNEDTEPVGSRVSPLLVIAKALLLAVKRNPDINATWDEANQEIVQKHYVNLGIAVATARGLVVPNIKDAGAMTLPELGEALGDLVSTARAGKTPPGAMRNGTITITNIGIFGVDTGTPILNPGESAVLAVGAIKLRPWVHKGKVKPRHIATLALSFDHRLVDGELGSKVLTDVAAILERPERLIAWS
ncbi:dihydrolipoamide acetyltransferase family protein [Streptomyces sp. NPDC048248]|uniref:dihydrolipoamide acetyltransferase family protein n=1 Tax=Streptomyces sp. NPDC048248 TaxID=3365523 RepID=UPI0037134140